eukprot:jgi/Astpho2/1698/fgenesh1_pm.00032_%23_14_t
MVLDGPLFKEYFDKVEVSNFEVASDAFSTFKDKLLQYLRQHAAGFPQNCQSLQVEQFSHGQSNPTYLIKAADAKYVLRKKPPGRVLASAHAVEREFRVLAALRNTHVPVPAALCLCEDTSVLGTPFYVMSHVQGRIFEDPSLPELQPQEREAAYHALATTLAALHSVKPQDVGLQRYGRPTGYCARQVWRWSQQYESQLVGSPLPEMQRLSAWLKDHVPADDEDPAVSRVSHGDFRLDNMVLHPQQAGEVLAVLDWELSTLGYPLADLAYSAMPYRLASGSLGLAGLPNPLPEGIPTEQQYVAIYCKARGIPEPDPVTYAFCMALSIFRGAAILAGVGARAQQGNASSAKAAQASKQPQRSAAGFEPSLRVADLRQQVAAFMQDHVYPAEHVLEAHAADPKSKWTVHPLMEQMKAKAREQGLWNLWLPADMARKIDYLCDMVPESERHLLIGRRLSNLEYAFLSEQMGRSVCASEVFNCSAPDTGNMEVLARYGSRDQQERWLLPLLQGQIRSCFAMTEPDVASSDATNIQSRIVREGSQYVINGHKWWASGAPDPRCKICIFMGKTDPSAATHMQQSMILVPMDAAGVTVVRPLPVYGYDDAPHGHAELTFENVRVPASSMLLGEGRGFEIAQGRLGPGRLHHCMRLIGMGERAFELMARRALQRVAFKKRVAEHGAFQADFARARIELSAARLTVLNAAHALDRVGNRAARGQIAAAKVMAPNVVLKVIDQAVQVHGGGGVCDDFPLARLWAGARTIRLADGPDDVHLAAIAKQELATASKL